MNAQKIERLDKQRYWAVMLQAVGLFLVFVCTLITYIQLGANPNMYVFGGSNTFLFAAGTLSWITGGIWYLLLWFKISQESRLQEALYNELYQQHKYRYQRYTLWFMVGISLVSLVILPLRYPHLIATTMIVFASLLLLKILWLIFNRK